MEKAHNGLRTRSVKRRILIYFVTAISLQQMLRVRSLAVTGKEISFFLLQMPEIKKRTESTSSLLITGPRAENDCKLILLFLFQFENILLGRGLKVVNNLIRNP
ncbi:hypothetical protein V1478_004416 [Vespula squamosa]|uniref:Uncharacterized protein n=1 Tax=Vespula squamosa TaxID=30214 RepID=A0ABD2BG56_VESSQ